MFFRKIGKILCSRQINSMFFRKIGKTVVVCIGFLLDFAHLLNKIFTFEKKIAFFLLTYSDFSYLWLRRKYSHSKKLK